MRRHVVVFSLAVGLLGAAGALLVLPRGLEEVRVRVPLDAVPVSLGDWRGSNHVPTDVLPVDPQVPMHLFRTYQDGTQTVWVSVGYYPLQGEGHRPPALQLVYPGRGWSELTAEPVRIALDEGGRRSIQANLLLVRAEGRRVALLYWYQVGGWSIASDHSYRAFLVYNRLVHRRADGALVRIASPVPDVTDAKAVVAVQTRFIRAFYRELLRSLPE